MGNAFSFQNDCGAGKFRFSVPSETPYTEVMASSPCPLDAALLDLLGFTDEAQFLAFIELIMVDASEDQEMKSYEDVTGDHQLDKNYFDGDSNWNNEKDLVASTGAALRAWNAWGTSKPIDWPTTVDNFHDCDARIAMCCFADNLDGDFSPNSQVCHHDLGKSPTSSHIKDGFSLFSGSADNAYCTSFTWPDDESHVQSRYKGNSLLFASFYNGRFLQKDAKNVPSAPMCGCIEKMPVVSKTDCLQVNSDDAFVFSFDADSDPSVKVGMDASLTFGECTEGNFHDHYSNLASAEEFDRLDTTNFIESCEDFVSDYFNDKFLVPGSTESPVDLSQWTQIVGEGALYYPSKGETFFRNAIANSPNSIVYRYCPNCRDDSEYSHKHIYYKRLTPIPPTTQLDFLDLFMNNWESQNNTLNVDFQLFSTYENALDEVDPWQKCNYNDKNIGFPRDCGPTTHASHQWNSYVKDSWSHAYNNAFYVEKQGPDMAF